jgi:hypothetical protein
MIGLSICSGNVPVHNIKPTEGTHKYVTCFVLGHNVQFINAKATVQTLLPANYIKNARSELHNSAVIVKKVEFFEVPSRGRPTHGLIILK